MNQQSEDSRIAALRLIFLMIEYGYFKTFLQQEVEPILAKLIQDLLVDQSRRSRRRAMKVVYELLTEDFKEDLRKYL